MFLFDPPRDWSAEAPPFIEARVNVSEQDWPLFKFFGGNV